MRPATAGDPITGLKWTRKTTTKVSEELRKIDIEVGPRTVARLLTDYNMPGTSGIDVAKEAQHVRPGLPVILTSGYFTTELQAEAEDAGIRHVLRKPYELEALVRIVQDLLGSAPRH